MLTTTCLARKFHDHQQRAAGLADCLPPWLWIDDDGQPEGWVFWAEVLDGLATLVEWCASPPPPAN